MFRWQDEVSFSAALQARIRAVTWNDRPSAATSPRWKIATARWTSATRRRAACREWSGCWQERCSWDDAQVHDARLVSVWRNCLQEGTESPKWPSVCVATSRHTVSERVRQRRVATAHCRVCFGQPKATEGSSKRGVRKYGLEGLWGRHENNPSFLFWKLSIRWGWGGGIRHLKTEEDASFETPRARC
jgi:hypothetical protein